MGVKSRCFVCWLNIVCHSLSGIRGREVLRHNTEQWGRSLESRRADRFWGIEPFKKEGRAEGRLENKLWTENDRGVMLLICSLLHDILFQARHEEVLELHFNNWLLSFLKRHFYQMKGGLFYRCILFCCCFALQLNWTVNRVKKSGH